MSQPTDMPNPFDPFGFWRTTQNASLDAWSKAMIELVNSDAYAQATARLLDAYLTASVPMRRAVEQAMTQVLSQVNMPTRMEVLSIAERMTNIEMRLDDLDARFDELRRTLTQIADNAATAANATKGTPSRTASAAASRRQSRSASTEAPANEGTGRARRTRTTSVSGRSAANKAKE